MAEEDVREPEALALAPTGDAEDALTSRTEAEGKPGATENTQELKKSVISEARFMNNMEGKEEKGDVRCVGMSSALESLARMVPASPAEEAAPFEFRSVHLGHGVAAGKSKRDIHRAFLLWSQKVADREADSFNVSKAFRRLQAFAAYSHRMFEPYFAALMDIESAECQTVAQVMKIHIPRAVHQETGAVVWAIDLDETDLGAMTDLPALGITLADVMRWFWTLLLASMFDDTACSQGVMIVEGLGNVGLSGMIKWQRIFKPIEKDLNELFYGVTCMKMRSCIIVGAPWWLSTLLGFMRLFISKKMSRRIKNVRHEKMLALMGGPACLPLGVLGGTGPNAPRYPGLTMGAPAAGEQPPKTSGSPEMGTARETVVTDGGTDSKTQRVSGLPHSWGGLIEKS